MTKTRYGYTLNEIDYWDLQDVLKEFRKHKHNEREAKIKCETREESSDKGDRYQRFHT